MTMVICKRHGPKGGEQVSKFLYDEFKNGHDISEKIKDFSFVIDDYECPFYGIQEEMEQLPEICMGGDFIVQSDERLSEVLGRITVMCVACLKEAMSGASLPVKDGVP